MDAHARISMQIANGDHLDSHPDCRTPIMCSNASYTESILVAPETKTFPLEYIKPVIPSSSK